MVAQLRTACCTLPASIYFEFMYVNWIWTATPGRGCAHCMAVMCALRFDGILIVSFNWKFNFKCYFLFCAATKRNWQCRQTKPSGTNGPYRSKSIWFGCFLSIFLTFFISFSAQFCDFRIAPKNFGNRNLKMYDSYEWLRQRLSSRKSEKKIIWISLDRFKTKWPFLDTVNIAMANCWPHTPQDDHKWLAWAHNSRLIFGKKKTNKLYSSKFLDSKMERLRCTDYARIYFHEPHDPTIEAKKGFRDFGMQRMSLLYSVSRYSHEASMTNIEMRTWTIA